MHKGRQKGWAPIPRFFPGLQKAAADSDREEGGRQSRGTKEGRLQDNAEDDSRPLMEPISGDGTTGVV